MVFYEKVVLYNLFVVVLLFNLCPKFYSTGYPQIIFTNYCNG